MTKRKPKPKPETEPEIMGETEPAPEFAGPQPPATPKKPSRTRAEIICDLLDDCKKGQLIEIAREACMRDGDWASMILTAFEDALAELEVAQNEQVEASALADG